MRSTRPLALLALACVCVGTVAGAQRPRFPAESVHIAVEIPQTGQARVREYVRLSAPVRTADFIYLARACNAVSSLRFERPPLGLGVATDTAPPWVVVHDTTELADAATSSAYDIRYDVELGGHTERIPIVMPAAALSTQGGAALRVVVVVTLGSSALRVVSPRMQRDGNRWSAKLGAMPSTIVVSGEGAPDATCDETGSATLSGDGGSFRLRFTLLLGTMALWVPLYFLWAHFARDEDAPLGTTPNSSGAL